MKKIELEKDKQILNVKQKKSTSLPFNMNDSEEILYNKRNEMNQKMVIKGGEVMDENQLKNRKILIIPWIKIFKKVQQMH